MKVVWHIIIVDLPIKNKCLSVKCCYRLKQQLIFSEICNIYLSRLYDVSVRLSVRLSVTEVHWRIIANLSFKIRSKYTAHFGRGEG